ncbi:MAG: 3-hydroxyacyl-CoA dehydrogenase family protein [Pseudomonadota bacterium]
MTAAVIALQDVFWQACEQMLFWHTNPWELDEALTDWGYGLGPCEAQDLVGLDVVLQNRSGSQPSPILGRMVAEGRLGKRAGWGYYRYPGGGGAVIDPLIDDLIREEAWFAKIMRDELEGEAVVRRLHGLVAPALRAAPDAVATALHFPAARLSEL